MAGALIIIVALLSVSNVTFIANLNSWAKTAGYSGGDYYHYIIETAKAQGFNPNPGFNWYDTYGMVVIMAAGLTWTYWSGFIGGEIKRAGQIMTQLIIMGCSLVFAVVLYLLMGFGLTNIIGSEFYASATYLASNNPNLVETSMSPFLTFFSSMAWPQYSLLLSIIFLISWSATTVTYILINVIAPVRVIFAASFDRLLPTWFSEVSERTHTPLKAAIFCGFVGAAQTIAWRFVPGFSTMILSSTMGTVPAVVLSLIAAIVLPFRKRTKSIYDLSPAKALKLGGMPLMSLSGLIGIVFLLSEFYYWWTVPSLGMASPTAVTYVVGVYIVLAVYYFAARAYRKGQGVNLDIAFAQIPPE
jgi:amino acid transporter